MGQEGGPNASQILDLGQLDKQCAVRGKSNTGVGQGVWLSQVSLVVRSHQLMQET